MRTLYNILFTCFFWLSAPYYFLRLRRRGGWRENFWQRFGRYDSKVKHAVTNRDVVWLHAVSVGEVNLCVQLIRALEPRLPNHKLVVSTTTTTGMEQLRERLPGHIEKIYYPVDLPGATSRALRVIHPQAVVIVEAEIWPNFLWKLKAWGAPAFLVNARVSERSYRGYKRFAFLFRPLFAAFAGVGVQNEADARRLIELGCRPEAVHVVGSLKFDASKVDERPPLDTAKLLRQVGVSASRPILVAGSTHPGEEALIARIFLRLKERFPGLFLVVAPRHFERGGEVGRELESLGVRFVYRREVTARTQLAEGEVDCLLVNTTGELKYFYREATAVFVGKSFTGRGGQNPIEPAALGKPIVFGPHMENFLAVAESFVREGGAIQARDPAELEQALSDLLADPALRERLGRNALAVVRRNTGALERTVEMILKGLREEGAYVAPPEAAI